MAKGYLAAGGLVIIAIGALVLLGRYQSPSHAPAPADVSPFQMLRPSGDDSFARVRSPWNFQFPADHSSHYDYRTEWWYFTGVLEDEARRRLGVQFVLMRLGLTATRPQRTSRWAASDMYAGLFSISDPVGDQLHVYQRISRAALGLAGSEVNPMRVWVEDWRLEQVAPHEGPLNARMRIADSGLELDLELRNVQPLIDANEIREQGPERTAPFQFYVQPRVSAKGTLQLGERQTTLGGTLAVEHAWGELPLPGGPVAQDRFTLHLDDGRELFCLRIHRVDGSGAPTTTGLLIGRDNRPLVLSTHEIELKPTAYWVSDLTRARYPIGWVLRVPRQEIDLKLVPYWEHQEGIAWLPFWAGPVRLRGSSATSALSGDGLVQLTGYNAL